jgi:hypothetical protein
MMAIDAGNRQEDAPRPDWTLPELVSLDIRRVPYQPPKLRNFESRLAQVGDVVEFVVETDRPFPARALSPALYIGDVMVAEGEALERTRYRFLAADPDRLPAGSMITLGWEMQPPSTRKETGYRYEPPADG